MRAFSCQSRPSREAGGGRDVHTVQDAALFQLHLGVMSVAWTGLPSLDAYEADSFSPLAEIQGVQPHQVNSLDFKRPSFTRLLMRQVLLLFPLENEDTFGALRRPQSVAEVAHHFTSLTSAPERNPLRYYTIMEWATAEREGINVVSCARAEFGALVAGTCHPVPFNRCCPTYISNCQGCMLL